MWRWYTAEDKRQAVAIVFLIVAILLTIEAFILVLAGPIAGALAGERVSPGGPGLWFGQVGEVLSSPGHPAAAFPGAGFPAWLYWLVAVTGATAAAVVGVQMGVMFYRSTAPTGSGFATRADVARELSLAACRARAAVTRPDLSRRDRRRASPSQVGVPLHRAAVTGEDLWLPPENATGVIAPQQSGKTLTDLIHKVLGAPAGILTTSTKLDLFLHTAAARERGGSTVHLLDLTGAASWPQRVRWSPVQGCRTVKAAKRRAQALVRAIASGATDSTGNHVFFERRAVDVMTAYLLAANLADASVSEFVRWCQNDLDTEATDILRTRPELAAVRRVLQQAQAVVEETRSGIWETLRDAVSCLTDPEVVANALPVAGQVGFDPEHFVRDGGSLYVIGSEDDAASQAPLITAFVQEVLDTARQLALVDSRHTGRERLTPPFTAVLDEVASICPLPDLPDTLSDSAGRGVVVHYALQSPAQAQTRWGKAAATLFDNTTALTLLGGLKSEETLKWASLLVGRRLEERRTRQTGRSFMDVDTRQIGQERVDILEPAAVRLIPRGRALLIMRAMPALIVTLKPAWKRRDWPQLQADAIQLRHQPVGTTNPTQRATDDRHLPATEAVV
jgi:hypothetical protein